MTRTRLALGLVAQFAGAATAFYVFFLRSEDGGAVLRKLRLRS